MVMVDSSFVVFKRTEADSKVFKFSTLDANHTGADGIYLLGSEQGTWAFLMGMNQKRCRVIDGLMAGFWGIPRAQESTGDANSVIGSSGHIGQLEGPWPCKCLCLLPG